jgi:hypothetical protein
MAGLNVVLSNLKRWENMKKAGLEGLARTAGAGMQGYARERAPWINQTGHARQGLRGGMYKEDKDIYSYIAHSVDYGIYLELCNDGKYAILLETRDKFAPEVRKQAERLMKL